MKTKTVRKNPLKPIQTFFDKPYEQKFLPNLEVINSPISELPDDLIDKLQMILENELIFNRSCVRTSMIVGLIPGVKIERGWWGHKISSENIQNLIDGAIKKINLEDDYLKIIGKDEFGRNGTWYIDLITNQLFSFHFWNSYKGIHFDLLQFCRRFYFGTINQHESSEPDYLSNGSICIRSNIAKNNSFQNEAKNEIDLFINKIGSGFLNNNAIILNRSIDDISSPHFSNQINLRDFYSLGVGDSYSEFKIAA